MQEIQLKFDAGKGSVSLSRITAVYGDRVGTLPKPTRRGHAFAGWYLSSEGDPTADGAVRVTADTVMDASLFEGDVLPETAVLYARWSREKDNAAKVKKKSSLANQKRAIVILCVVAVVLVAAFAVASVLADIYHYEDTDGTVYTIRKKQGEFGLYLNGTLCDVDKDGYFLTTVGNMLEIDPKTGEYEIYAVVDTFDTEEVGVNRRVLMFKQLTYDESSTNDLSRVIKQIEIHNQEGSYTLVRGSNGFEIKDHPTAVLNTQIFAQLSSGCGYTLAMQRLEKPVRTADGSIDYTEYGLAPQTRPRLDEEGNPLLDDDGNTVTYDYTPSHYTVTTMTGDTYNVTLGDATVSGTGYYARYEDRDTVYILSATNLSAGALQPVESLVTPMITYPMTMSSYFQVSNFVYRTDIDYDRIYRDLVLELVGLDIDTLVKDENGEYPADAMAKLEEASRLSEEMDPEDFSVIYDRLLEKNSRLVTAFSYIDLLDRENTLFSSIPYQMSSEYMAGYLPNSDNINSVLQKLYDMTFEGVMVLGPTDEDLADYGLEEPAHRFSFIYKNAEGLEFTNEFVVSAKTEDGLYYAYSPIHDMIVRIDKSQMAYLDWEEIDWYEREYFQANIAHTQTIKLEGAGLPSPIVFTLDNSRSDQSEGVNSDKLVVLVNGQKVDYTLTVTKPSGSVETATSDYNFRRLFQSLLVASMEGNTDLSEEQMEALRNSPEENCVLKLTVLCDDGQGNTQYNVYRFYRYTERKAYMTIETLPTATSADDPTRGQGVFYVLASFCDKLLADAERFLNAEEIIVNSKN